jgi:oxygen-independent coproporphyrinogen III oxidase
MSKKMAPGPAILPCRFGRYNAAVQTTLPTANIQCLARPRAAYVHVPFCAHRCGYCSFTLVAGRDDLIDRYLEAIGLELARLGEPRPIDTLFLGGGTPTHLPPDRLDRLIRRLRERFVLASGYEFSVEANPVDLDPAVVDLLADLGVNRISLGGQSFDPAKLALLERDHTPAILRRAVQIAKQRIGSVSLDLIFGTPGESLAGWQRDLDAALELEPDHVSTYGLTFERGTHFWTRLAHGNLVQLDEETERELYATTIDTLTAAGFEHYEVSNFARPGHRCRHNEAYWAGAGYYAVGPGAASYEGGRRQMNHRSTTTWLKRVLAGESAVAESEELLPADRAREALVFGLRRLAGVSRASFREATGEEIDRLVGPRLTEFVRLGLLEDCGDVIRLTRAGLFVSDSIWPHFLRA